MIDKKVIVVVGADVQSDALGHHPGYPLPPPHDPPRSRFQVHVVIILSVPKVIANLYCICLSIYFRYT